MLWIPAVEEERLAMARRRAGLGEGGTRWRSVALIPRVIFYALTLVGLLAFTGLLALADLPWALGGGMVALGAGEWLIVGKRLYHAGPDDALWTAGPALLLIALPSSSAPERWLVAAGAGALAGARLRNGLVLAASLPLVCAYVHLGTPTPRAGAVVAVALACLAVILARRQWRDPLVEAALSWTILALPLVAYALDVSRHGLGGPWHARVALAIVLAATFIAAGASGRHRATLVSGVLIAAAVAIEYDQRLPWPAELRLVMWGLATLVAALVVSRILRRDPGGITAKRAGEVEGYRLAELSAVALAAPATTQPDRPSAGGDGRFGGGGASADF